MDTSRIVLIIHVVFSCFKTSRSVQTAHIYVSPEGLDSNDGLSTTKPLRSLQKAIEKLDGDYAKGKEVYVELMKGYHDLTKCLNFSHGYPAPVTFRSYQNQEVHVAGGRRIPTSLFTKVTDSQILQRIPKEAHNKVRQVKLPDTGITDYGKLSVYGYYIHRTAPLEIFINGQPLHLAEWPNKNYINIDTALDGRSGRRFTHNASRDARWVGENDPWAYGFWYYGWAEYSAQIASIDPVRHLITLEHKPNFGMKNGSLRYDGELNGFNDQGGYFRVMNMLSELDQPGEYYLDRSTGILYLWPNTPTETLQDSDVIYASIVDDCIRLPKGINNLNFEDFTLEACRRYGISGVGSRNVQITNLQIRNTGSYGVNCNEDCRSVTVSKCDIHDTDGGVFLEGGDRTNLISSGNIVEDNHIWKFGRATQVGANGIDPEGVNHIVRYNYIHDCPYTGIYWAGNDHIMEYNHISHCCHDATDCGGFHAVRDWTMRGNIIRYNYIHDTIKRWPGADVRGVMLDDEYSSVTIENNVFYRNMIHANIGGGRDNIIRYNVFYDALKASVQVDGRGLSPERNSKALTNHLSKVPYTSTIWANKYPKLAAMSKNVSDRVYPNGNSIYRNLYFNQHGKMWILFSGQRFDDDRYFKHYQNKHSFSKSDFTSPDNDDYRLQCSAKDWANGVNFPQPITIDKVGPRHPYGPRYLKGVKPTVHSPTTYTDKPCTTEPTKTPETDIPTGSYLPDGSSPNTLVTNITSEGCWIVVAKCPNHSNKHDSFRDTFGEEQLEAAVNETNCLSRAVDWWRYCGSSKDNPVAAVFGPTGAMTQAGEGCYLAGYGCPSHDGHTVGISRDSWAERHMNASTDEEQCLIRAQKNWVYCGKDRHKPFTSIFRPTGALRTAGAGCWIKIPKCPADTTVKYYFYDSWGATNLDTDFDEEECLNRSGYFWRKCGSNTEYPVTAYFRPTTREHTEPSSR